MSEPVITLVVAMAENGVIGHEGKLPWHLPADLAHFKRITQGYPIIMGRRTYESIGKALPERMNIIVSRTPGFAADGCTVVGCLDEALQAAGEVAEVKIIGGAQLYQEALPQAQRIELTQVHGHVQGDTFFPRLDLTEWQQVAAEAHAADERNAYALSFLTLERR